MKKKKRNSHRGSSLESYLKERGIFEEVKAAAMKRVLELEVEEKKQKAMHKPSLDVKAEDKSG